MRSVRLCLLLSFLLLSGLAWSQQTQPAVTSPPRDAQAIAAVQRAIDALGGATAISQIQTWQAQAKTQTVTPAGNTVNGTLSLEMSGAEFRMAFTTPEISWSLVTGHGSPAVVNASGTIRSIPSHVMRARFIPSLAAAILLRELNNPNYWIAASQSVTLASGPASVVVTGLVPADIGAAVTPQKWYFDTASGLPVRVEYRIPSEGSPLATVMGAFDLSNYQSVAGILYPFHIIGYVMDEQVQTIDLTSVNENAPIAPSDFDAPAGGAQ